ncbi:hypothetical protein F2P81_012489 [Scophthalmus maximus]|uniref:Recombining binding protein suppressor of hairless-like protein n=1 Tax=Scophthalmus maximus TaxID=52904 RepID=A0A6A4SUK7_SCOMX|nr:hypothetical protein F2P81_012489 [Scophthalmus maximus]
MGKSRRRTTRTPIWLLQFGPDKKMSNTPPSAHNCGVCVQEKKSDHGPGERRLLLKTAQNAPVMEESDDVEDGSKEAPMHRPGCSPADAALLFPPPLPPDPLRPLTHLGTLLAGHDAPRTGGGWDRFQPEHAKHALFAVVLQNNPTRPDPGFQGSQSLGTTREPGREAHADQSVIILHAKVAQKSYGNEKRFFCPPPCVYISGHGWRVMQDHLKAAGYGDSVYRVCGYMCLDSSSQSQADAFKLVFDEQPNSRQMFACAKTLFISDQDKRKHFRLLLRLFLGSSQEVGSFQSRLIKVISKPSQKRQSMKNADLCISSCSRVALFNRLRSQTVIRKVNKQHAILDVDEPVSQLHKCAFQFRDSPHAYLCLSNDTIVQYQAPSSVRDPSRVVLNDGSCWTIIGVETVEFTFNEGLACIQTPVSPFPVITGLEVNGGGHVAMLEIHGENFGPHLKVWFGNSEAETMFKSPKSLLCVVPDVSVFSDSWRSLRRVIIVPLSLIRLDGLIYRTSFSFTYTPELLPPPSVRGGGGGGAAGGGGGGGGKRDGGMDGAQEDDVLLETIHQEFTRANFHLFMQS